MSGKVAQKTPEDNGTTLVISNPNNKKEEYNPVGEVDKQETSNSAPKDERPQWGSQAEFILSTIGSVVGLGNLWRFPIKVKDYGGGVFLIPYFTMLLVEGIPLFMVEMWIGQKFRAGCIGGFYKIHKALSGIGFATWMIGFYTNLYYNAIIMYTIYYFFASFAKVLPWAGDCPAPADAMDANVMPYNCCTTNTRSSYYWHYEVLELSPSISQGNGFSWELTLCLFAAWLTCFLCMLKGIKTSGKVVYVTAIFPFVLLLGLFIMSMTLDGAMEGVQYFFNPNYRFSFMTDKQAADSIINVWKYLYNPDCWLAAALHVFYSLSLGSGSSIALASYNDPKTKFYKHAIGISLINSLTDIIAGVTIFAILGSSAKKTSTPIRNLWSLFIAVGEAIANTPWSQLWSAIFFLMLFLFGISSQFARVEGMMTALDDTTFIPKKLHRTVLIGGLCSISFILGLPFAMRNGMYMVYLFDNFLAYFPLLLIAFFEVISVSWVYGINRFFKDFRDMTGYYPNIIWHILLVGVTPISILGILLHSIVKQSISLIQYRELVGHMDTVNCSFDYLNYPPWAWHLGFFLILSSYLFIPIFAALAFLPKLLGPGDDFTFPLVFEHEDRQKEAAKKQNTEMTVYAYNGPHVLDSV